MAVNTLGRRDMSSPVGFERENFKDQLVDKGVHESMASFIDTIKDYLRENEGTSKFGGCITFARKILVLLVLSEYSVNVFKEICASFRNRQILIANFVDPQCDENRKTKAFVSMRPKEGKQLVKFIRRSLLNRHFTEQELSNFGSKVQLDGRIVMYEQNLYINIYSSVINKFNAG